MRGLPYSDALTRLIRWTRLRRPHPDPIRSARG